MGKISISRYRPVGWRGDSYRHYLARKGIKTKHNYFAVDVASSQFDLGAGSVGGSGFQDGSTGVPTNDSSKGNREKGLVKALQAKGFTKEDMRTKLGLPIAPAQRSPFAKFPNLPQDTSRSIEAQFPSQPQSVPDEGLVPTEPKTDMQEPKPVITQSEKSVDFEVPDVLSAEEPMTEGVPVRAGRFDELSE